MQLIKSYQKLLHRAMRWDVKEITSMHFLSTLTTNRPTDHFLDASRSYQDYIRGKTSSVQGTVSHPSCHDATIRRCKHAPWEYGVVITAVYLGPNQGK